MTARHRWEDNIKMDLQEVGWETLLQTGAQGIYCYIQQQHTAWAINRQWPHQNKKKEKRKLLSSYTKSAYKEMKA